MDMKSNRPKVYVRQDSVRGLQRSLGLSDGAMAKKIGVSRLEVQITTTGVMIRPQTGEQRLWLSTADAKFLATVVNNRPGLVSNTWFAEGGNNVQLV
uniref:Uncharacterized protein n=1 Tax=Siphoviridae sp. ctvph17 TaxID=2825724 RepID=A0A8S5UJV6_9CAUD|nr:MAG TPA: hypothetical protein [Siphoviridae sp. ctvph17]